MAEYRYAGPHPVPDEDNELVHPGDVREFDTEPDRGPWELLGEPETAPADPPADPPPASFPAAPSAPEGI